MDLTLNKIIRIINKNQEKRMLSCVLLQEVQKEYS